MNLDQFSTVVDGQRYINPQVALDESNAFIETLRDSQKQRTAEIAQDTYNLGTAVPSNLGGLGGAGSYFTSRYQTPQTNEVVANLRATAQAQALNDAMNNVLAQAKQRYNNAYKAYQRRHSNTGGGNGDDKDKGNNNKKGKFDTKTPDELSLELSGTTSLDSGPVSGQLRKYYILTKDGKRVPVNAVGSGKNMTLDVGTDNTGSYMSKTLTGADAINKYMSSVYGNGGKLLQRSKSGKVTDISSSPMKHHAVWGI